MSSPRIVATGALALALTAAACVVILRDANPPAMAAPAVPAEAGPDGGAEWLLAQRTRPDSTVDLGARHRVAIEQAGALARSATAGEWSSLGPTNIGGRVTDLAVDPTKRDVVYAASASGGVWRSTDAGQTFTHTWPSDQAQGIGALAITKAGVLYAGAGEANPGGNYASNTGDGLFRSTDGGTTWQYVGLKGSDRIGGIAIDPTNDKRMFVAAAGTLYQHGGERGLFMTEDGGATWTKTLAGANPTTGAIDVTINPADPRIVYAAMWDHHRLPHEKAFGGVGSGLHRSVDGGKTWTRLAGGLPSASANLGRIGVTIAPSDPNRVYATAMDASGGVLGMWSSNNRGDSWTKIGDSTFASSQGGFGWWFGRIFVDPKNPDHVFIPGVPLLESTNGGRSFRSINTVHADQHAMAWDPHVPNRVFLGNDGGVYTSTSNGSGTWAHTRSLGNTQFYTIAVSQQDPSRVSGGLQDNGSVRSWANWGQLVGGDGLANVIDPTNHNKVYACSQQGHCHRSTNGGASTRPFGATHATRRAWLTPVVLDPNNPSIVYYGGERLNRSTNSAASFTAISPDLSRGSMGNDRYGTISTIGIPKADSRVIYAGTDDSRMWITRDTGATWTEISEGLPRHWITKVLPDPVHVDTAYVSLSGYAHGTLSSQVHMTTDGGKSWRAIAGNLPNAPVNDLAFDPRDSSVLYAATDVGVFVTRDKGANWTAVGSGLPMVACLDLETSTAGGPALTVGTFGLGVYRTALS